MPRGWEEDLGFLAESYGWAPSELWAMDAWDLHFWFERLAKRKRHG